MTVRRVRMMNSKYDESGSNGVRLGLRPKFVVAVILVLTPLIKDLLFSIDGVVPDYVRSETFVVDVVSFFFFFIGVLILYMFLRCPVCGQNLGKSFLSSSTSTVSHSFLAVLHDSNCPFCPGDERV